MAGCQAAPPPGRRSASPERQKELLREFGDITGQVPDEQHESFFGKVKRAFKGE